MSVQSQGAEQALKPKVITRSVKRHRSASDVSFSGHTRAWLKSSPARRLLFDVSLRMSRTGLLEQDGWMTLGAVTTAALKLEPCL